ncbi:fibronectin type III-like domain-contianing protein [Streptomyces sp. NPDC059862]|uniref:fibronectin type III-like domain-contianing protein n=1 Tax=Streptomyces sp. NPDC059862 TaxID=3346975 RepID=UPI003667C3F2
MQLYVAPVDPAEDRPTRRLAGFATATAAPGETVHVYIPLTHRAYQVWDERKSAWVTAPGPYLLHASRNAADDVLTTRLKVPGRP